MNLSKNFTCFKAYDVRGKLGEELTVDIAYKIGRATAQSKRAKTLAVGFDARATSPDLARAVIKEFVMQVQMYWTLASPVRKKCTRL